MLSTRRQATSVTQFPPGIQDEREKGTSHAFPPEGLALLTLDLGLARAAQKIGVKLQEF
jgi:hypothetical protein